MVTVCVVAIGIGLICGRCTWVEGGWMGGGWNGGGWKEGAFIVGGGVGGVSSRFAIAGPLGG